MSGMGYVPPVAGDYDMAQNLGLRVYVMLFETFGGFGPDVTSLLKLAAAQVDNRLSHAQYDETTWSARTWMSFSCQRISVALHTAVAWELATAYEARSHTVANDPRTWAGGRLGRLPCLACAVPSWVV